MRAIPSLNGSCRLAVSGRQFSFASIVCNWLRASGCQRETKRYAVHLAEGKMLAFVTGTLKVILVQLLLFQYNNKRNFFGISLPKARTGNQQYVFFHRKLNTIKYI